MFSLRTAAASHKGLLWAYFLSAWNFNILLFPKVTFCLRFICSQSVINYLVLTINFPHGIRGAVGAVKFQRGMKYGMKYEFMRKLAQSKPFGLRRRCVGCIPTGCRTVLLRNRIHNSNGQTANRERQLAAAKKKRPLFFE